MEKMNELHRNENYKDNYSDNYINEWEHLL